MALKGSLGDFGISEILQMIGHQKKSGVMEVHSKGRTVKILFDSGRIVSAERHPVVPEFELAAILLGSGLVTPSQMEVARRQSQESLQPIEVILLNSRAVGLEDLKEMIMLKNLEILYDLFLWDEGDYEFEQQPVNYAKQLSLPISCEQVLMDGYRVKDEWPEVKKWLPDLTSRLERRDRALNDGEKLSPDMGKIYRMINGERTALDVAFKSRLGRFEAAKALAHLIERGYAGVVQEDVSAMDSGKTSLALEIPVYALFVILVLLFMVGIFRNLVRMDAITSGPSGLHAELYEDLQMKRINYALEVYNLLYGDYPARLGDLVNKGILDEKELLAPWGTPYVYQKNADGYRLESPVKSRSSAEET